MSLSPSLPGATPRPSAVPCQSSTASQLWGLLIWGKHRELKVCTRNGVASGLRLPPPAPLPVSPAHGDEAGSGEALQALGNLPSARLRAGRARVGSDAVCIPQAWVCLAGGLHILRLDLARQGVRATPGAALGWVSCIDQGIPVPGQAAEVFPALAVSRDLLAAPAQGLQPRCCVRLGCIPATPYS